MLIPRDNVFSAFVAAVEQGYFEDECLSVSVYPGGPGYDPSEFIDKDVCSLHKRRVLRLRI